MLPEVVVPIASITTDTVLTAFKIPTAALVTADIEVSTGILSNALIPLTVPLSTDELSIITREAFTGVLVRFNFGFRKSRVFSKIFLRSDDKG